jgi:hypothetical protein
MGGLIGLSGLAVRPAAELGCRAGLVAVTWPARLDGPRGPTIWPARKGLPGVEQALSCHQGGRDRAVGDVQLRQDARNVPLGPVF